MIAEAVQAAEVVTNWGPEAIVAIIIGAAAKWLASQQGRNLVEGLASDALAAVIRREVGKATEPLIDQVHELEIEVRKLARAVDPEGKGSRKLSAVPRGLDEDITGPMAS